MDHATTLATWIDRDYDTDRASDEVSRYGAYVRDIARDDFAWQLDGEDARVAFAAMAWRAATGPVMSPGYVRYHHLITGTKVSRSGWDGSLTVAVSLATEPPAGLARQTRWHGWPTEMMGDHDRPVEPYEKQVADLATSTFYAGYALTTVELVFTLPAAVVEALPPLPAAPDAPDLTHAAAEAVGVLVGAINDVVVPVLDSL